MIRLQLRLRGRTEEAFGHLVDMLRGAPKEIVLDGLALLHFAAQEASVGRKIGSLDPKNGEFRAVAIMSLQALGARQSPEASVAPAAQRTKAATA